MIIRLGYHTFIGNGEGEMCAGCHGIKGRFFSIGELDFGRRIYDTFGAAEAQRPVLFQSAGVNSAIASQDQCVMVTAGNLAYLINNDNEKKYD